MKIIKTDTFKTTITKSVCLLLAVIMFTLLLPNVQAFSFERRPNTSFNRVDNVNEWYGESHRGDAVALRAPRLNRRDNMDDFGRVETERTQFTRTFRNADGSYTRRIYSTPIQFYDRRGRLQDIDNTLTRTRSGGFLGFGSREYYANTANSYEVLLPVNPSENQGVTIRNDNISLELVPLFGDLQNPVAIENSIRYNSVAYGIDLQYTAFETGVKEYIILNHPGFDAVFSYELRASSYIEFILADNTIIGVNTRTNAIAVTITAPVMFDSNSSESDEIVLQLDGNIMTVSPCLDWVGAPERAFPIFVDPIFHLDNHDLINHGIINSQENPASNQDWGWQPWVGRSRAHLIIGFDTGWYAPPPVALGWTESWVRFGELPSEFFTGMPENSVMTAHLRANVSTMVNPGSPRTINAVMQLVDWHGAPVAHDPWMHKSWFNRPVGDELLELDSSTISNVGQTAVWDITDAILTWRANPNQNFGMRLVPDNPTQDPTVFIGAGSYDGGINSFHIEINWTVPNPVDPNFPLNAPQVNLRPIADRAPNGQHRLQGVFADGVVRPTLDVRYRMNNSVNTPFAWQTYETAMFGRTYPNSDVLTPAAPTVMPFGWRNLFQSNWQSMFWSTASLPRNRLHHISAYATDNDDIETPTGQSDTFIIHRMEYTDTIPFVANFYGVTREQIVRDNRTGDNLVVPGNTLFIRNPSRNHEIPHTRPANMPGDHMTAIALASMGRNMGNEFDMEPVNMNTGNWFFEAVDAENTEVNGAFSLVRSYNSQAPMSAGVFGRGWSFNYHQLIQQRENGDVLLIAGDGRHITFPRVGNGWGQPDGFNYTLTRVGAHRPLEYSDINPNTIRYEIRDANGVIRHFNSWGVMTRITNERGLDTTIHYNAEMRMTGITTPSGRNYAITKNPSGQIIQITLPNGSILRYEYDNDARLTAFINADGDRIRYTYNTAGILNAWFDGNGNRIIYNTYDNRARVIRQIDPHGNTIEVQYSENGTTLTWPNGETIIYHHDAATLLSRGHTIRSLDGTTRTRPQRFSSVNRLEYTEDQAGNRTYFTYDNRGNITRETRADGAFREITFNTRNLPLTIRDFDGSITTHEYNAAGDKIRTTRPDGSTIIYAHDNLGRVTSITDGEGNTTTFVRTNLANHQLRMVETAPNGNTTTFYYDAMGRVVNMIDHHGTEIRTMYSAHGRRIGHWTTGGIREDFEFDGAGNVIAIVDSYGNRTTFTYNAANMVSRATNPLGGWVEFEYDERDRKVLERDSEGNVTTFEYDADGNLIAITNPRGDTAKNVYDENGRRVKHIDFNGVETHYEHHPLLGLITRMTVFLQDGSYTATEFEYDAYGRLIRQQEPDGNFALFTYNLAGLIETQTDHLGIITTFKYDREERVIHEFDNKGRSTRSTFDELGNLVSVINSLGYEMRFEFDILGRMTREIAANGAATQFIYDIHGRVIETIDALGNSARSEFDRMGRVTATIDARGNRTEFRFNALGDLVAEICARGGVTTFYHNYAQILVRQVGPMGETTQFIHDEDYNVITTIDPNGNRTYSEFDGNGNVVATVDALGNRTEMEFDGLGRVVRTTHPTGLVESRIYDNMSRILKEYNNAGSVTTYEYNTLGQLISQTDAAGRISRFYYDEMGRQIRSVDFNGDTTETTFDILGRTLTTTTQDGRVTTNTYDSMGNIIAVTDHDGITKYSEFDIAGNLIRTIDPAGNATEFIYDENGNQVETINPDGTSQITVFDESNQAIEQIDANGNSTHSEFDLSGRQIRTIDAVGAITETIFDYVGNATHVRDAYGYVTRTIFDELNRAIEVISPRGGRTLTEFDEGGRVVRQVDAVGVETTFTHDLNGNILTQTEPSGLVILNTYDVLDRQIRTDYSDGFWRETVYCERGNVTSERDSNGAISTFEHDLMHRIIREVNPLGGVTTNQYCDRGNIIRTIVPNGAVTTFEHDVLDRVIVENPPLLYQIHTEFDVMGRVVSTTQGNQITRFEHDYNGNVIAEIDALGNRTATEFDELNRPVAVTDANGNTSRVEYDLLGRVVREIDPLGNYTATEFDADGNAVLQIDALGFETQLEYDLAGQLTRVIDPVGRRIDYTHDNAGNVVAMRISSNHTPATLGDLAHTINEYRTTSYTFDVRQNMTSITSTTDRVERFEYDNASRRISHTRADESIVRYEYDVAGNLVQIAWDCGSLDDVLHVFDESGVRISMTNELGTTYFEYDYLGRLAARLTFAGHKTQYEFDNYGRLSSITNPDGSVVVREYDLANRLISVEDSHGITHFEHDAVGNILGINRPNGVITTQTFDERNMPVSITHANASGATISSFEYEFDAAGRIVSENTIQNNTTFERSFTYDEVGQISRWTEYQDGTLTIDTRYGFNQFGNRVSTTRGADNYRISREYNDDNQLVRITQSNGLFSASQITTFEYDERGNLTSRTAPGTTRITPHPDENVPGFDIANTTVTTTYEFDAANRLTAVREDGALLSAMLYDGDDTLFFEVLRTTSNHDRNRPNVPLNPELEDESNSHGNGEHSYGSDAHDVGNNSNFSRPTEDETTQIRGEVQYRTVERTLNRVNDDRERIYQSALDSGANNSILNLGRAVISPIMSWISRITRRYDTQTQIVGVLTPHGQDVEIFLQFPNGREVNISGANNSIWNDTGAINNPNSSLNRPDTIYIPQDEIDWTRVDFNLFEYASSAQIPNFEGLDQVIAVRNLSRGEDWYTYSIGDRRLSSSYNEFYLFDGRGSISETISQNGEVLTSLRYDIWGETTTLTNSIDESIIFGYNGERLNTVTNLQYLRFRHYSPKMGTFISEDSWLGVSDRIGSRNRYAYVEGDPINHQDPTGHYRNPIFEWKLERLEAELRDELGSTLSASLMSQIRATGAQSHLDFRVSDERANAYIQDGIQRLVSLGHWWGCEPGALTNLAVSNWNNHANTAIANSNNEKSRVRSQNIENWQWQQELARRQQEQAARDAARRATANQTTSVTNGNQIVFPWDFIGPLPPNAIRAPGPPPGPLYRLIMGGVRAGDSLFEWVNSILGTNFNTAGAGSFFLMMYQNPKTGTIHANQNNWQQFFGFNMFYEEVFGLATSKLNAIFPFTSGGNHYVLWAWKGNYLNLGAGAEMAIYDNPRNLPFIGEHWRVNTNLAMNMSMRVYLDGRNIINYSPGRVWWITGFNPRYRGVTADRIRAVYTVDFSRTQRTRGKFQAFSSRYGGGRYRDTRWTFNDSSHRATLNF